MFVKYSKILWNCSSIYLIGSPSHNGYQIWVQSWIVTKRSRWSEKLVHKMQKSDWRQDACCVNDSGKTRWWLLSLFFELGKQNLQFFLFSQVQKRGCIGSRMVWYRLFLFAQYCLFGLYIIWWICCTEQQRQTILQTTNG